MKTATLLKTKQNSVGSSNEFMTPPYAIEPLLSIIPKDWIVWECACGTGNLINAFQNNGYNTVGTDIYNGWDFTTMDIPFEFDCIVTNPPYTPASIKLAFLERVYSIGKPFAFLMPLTTLEGKKRQNLFRQFGLEVIVLDKRINFETPSGKGSGAWFPVAWFTWNMNIGKQLMFYEFKEAIA